MTKFVAGLAVVLTALALVPGGAHLFELPRKMQLAQANYFLVQSIYRGWALFGLVTFLALAANAAAAALLGRLGVSPWWSIAACALIVGSLVVFFTWTQPANVATLNWMIQPDAWQGLRRQWEYSHAAGAGLTFLALICAVTGSLNAGGRSRGFG
jgi:hypothetical protein